jgi:hypothetical protein
MSKPPTARELKEHEQLCKSHDKVLLLMNSVEIVLVCGFAYFIGPHLKPNLPSINIPLPQQPSMYQHPNFYHYSFLLPILKKNKSNKVKSILKIILTFIFIIFFYYINLYTSFFKSNQYLIKVFIILLSSMIIFYLFITGLIILNYSIRKDYNKEVVTSNYLPKFIKNYLINLKEISNYYNYNSFVKLYFMSGTFLLVLLILFILLFL